MPTPSSDTSPEPRSATRGRSRVEVAVVGTVNLDHTVHVERLPAPGETVVGDALLVAPGGKGANQAVAAARQGARTALIACVGDDSAGDDLLAFLGAQPGLDLRGVARVAAATGAAFVTVDGSGGNTVVSARGANACLTEEHVHRHGRAIADAAVVLATLGVPHDAVRAAFEIARSVGTMTVLDPSPAADVTDELLRLTDLCTPNESEAHRLTAHAVDDVDGARRAAAALLARGCAAVAITLGSRGVWYAEAGPAPGETQREAEVAPFVVDAVDTTAAGDAFCGALAAALARGAPMAEALADGAAAGALATTVPGGADAAPPREAVAALRGASG